MQITPFLLVSPKPRGLPPPSTPPPAPLPLMSVEVCLLTETILTLKTLLKERTLMPPLCYINHDGVEVVYFLQLKAPILPLSRHPHYPLSILSPPSWIQLSNSEVQVQVQANRCGSPYPPFSFSWSLFLISGCHSIQSRPFCRFPRIFTTLVTHFVSSMISSWPLHFSLSQHFLIRLSPGYPPWTIKFMYYR